MRQSPKSTWHFSNDSLNMRSQTEHLSWLVTCDLPGELRKAEDAARHEASLDRIIEVKSQSAPGGVLRTTLHYRGRLGDLFTSVRVLAEPTGGRNAFGLDFYPADDANRFWKDIMVRILRAVQQSASGVSINRIEDAH
jgi:hypothetical protein